MQKIKTRKSYLKMQKPLLRAKMQRLANGMIARLDFGRDGKGIVPMIIQDSITKQVLSLVWANRQSLERTLKTGYLWRYSRQAGKVVKKGATSGNTQKLVSVQPDCDNDAILAIVEQKGNAACHTGAWSCFGTKRGRNWGFLDTLLGTIKGRIAKPSKKSYVWAIAKKPSRICAKLQEEAAELSEALVEKDDKEVVWEAADVLFFTLVALESRKIDAGRVLAELEKRHVRKKACKKK